MPKVPVRWAAPLIAAIYAGVAVFAWSEQEWRSEWDSASYLVTARSIAEGSGYRYQGEPFFLRPPGFSFALSLLIGAEGEIDFAFLNRLVGLCAGLALLAIALALRPTLGQHWALLAAVLAMTGSCLIGYLNWIQADLLYLAVFYLALWLLDGRRDPESIRLTRVLAGALLLVIAAHLRTVALLLLPGVVLGALAVRNLPARRRLIAGAFAAAALCLPWLLEARELAAAASRPAEQLFLFDYWTAMFHVDPGDPNSAYVGWSGWLERLSNNARGLHLDISMSTVGTSTGPATFAFFGFALLGFVIRVRRSFSLLEWHTVSYLLLMLTYFTQDLRLLIPLLPALYAYVLTGAWETAEWVAERLGFKRWVAALPVLVAAALLIQNLAALPRGLDAASLGSDRISLGQQWESHRRVAAWLRENTPADARILAGNAPVLSLLSERRVYTFRFMRRPGITHRYAIDYVVFYPATPKEVEQSIATAGAVAHNIPVYDGRSFVRVFALEPSGRLQGLR